MVDPLSNSVYAALPSEAVALLRRVSAPPRLIAHLILVHDVACRLVERSRESFPDVVLDGEAVSFGASIHDFGKAVVRNELVQPGKEHEKRGLELLRQMGISESRARFAYTHGNWDTITNPEFEDLIIALADNCWKGKRVDQLETKTIEFLSSRSGQPAWGCYSKLDEILEELSADADSRLAWQGAFDCG